VRDRVGERDTVEQYDQHGGGGRKLKRARGQEGGE
jgi:hypothetical protein